MHTEVDQAINIRKSVDYTFKLFFTTTILSWPTVFFFQQRKNLFNQQITDRRNLQHFLNDSYFCQVNAS